MSPSTITPQADLQDDSPAQRADAQHRITRHLAQALGRTVFSDAGLAEAIARRVVSDLSSHVPGLILRVPAEAYDLPDPAATASRLHQRPTDVTVRDWARRCGVSQRTAYRLMQQYPQQDGGAARVAGGVRV